MSTNNFPDLKANFLKHLPADKNARILDYGCGDGRVVKFLQQLGYTNIEAADSDDILLRQVSEKFNVPTHIIEDTQKFLEGQTGLFDLVIAKDVIYYFPTELLVPNLTLMRKALKPNGLFICEIFNGATFTGPYVKYKDLGIHLILDEHSLKNSINAAGFNILSIQGNRFYVTNIKSIIFSWLQSCWRLTLKLIFFLERGIDSQNPKIFAKKIIIVAKA